MPGNIDRLMAQEVGRIEHVPQRRPGFLVERLLPHQPNRFLLASVNRFGTAVVSVQLGAFSPLDDARPSAAEQILQKLGFPGIPDFRTRASNICHGQEIQGHKSLIALNKLRERIDDVGVMHVLFLGDRGHSQVVVDQPGNQFGVGLGNSVSPTESQRVLTPKF